MAYITVTTAIDVVAPGDGKLSLREAVAEANATDAPDTIVFAADIAGMTVTLTQGELLLSEDLTIDGAHNGAAATIDGSDQGRILHIVGGGTDVVLSGLTLANGNSGDAAGHGGAVLLGGGGLVMNAVTVRDSHCGYLGYYGNGGGLFAEPGSRVALNHSRFHRNTASNGGGLATGADVVLSIRSSRIADNATLGGGSGGGIAITSRSVLTIDASEISENRVTSYGGGIDSRDSHVSISRSTLSENYAEFGAGIHVSLGNLLISNSTIANNKAASGEGGGWGGGIAAGGGINAVINSTVTGNFAGGYCCGDGGGIRFQGQGTLSIVNTIVAGNFQTADYKHTAPSDITGTITLSNGHNVFGSDVAGNIPGDRENIAPATIFAALDSATGGGRLGPDGIVALRNNVANPALSAGDPILANVSDQRGATRPQPGSSLPDLGAVELDQPLSTGAGGNNDQLTGTNAVNKLTGFAGADYLKGLGGNDTLEGGPGGDLLDGGPGNDTLQGGLGLDLAAYPGAAAVIIDLSGTTDTAKRGSETDTLIGIEGALGSNGNDTFKGDELNNEFQGKTGKDTMTGGAGRDTWDFNAVADSPAGATRDLVTDFVPGQDIIDLAGVDADSTVPGNQSFRWVAKANLTGTAQLGYFVSGATTIVRASTDADAATEIEIQLIGAKTLTAVDFRP